MAQRQHSIVLFGATGFTGNFVLQELLACPDLGLPIAVAGRSASKLKQLLQQLGVQPNGRVKVLSGVDIADQDSLKNMASTARLVINVVGPYRLYGEPVVRACVEAGTDYLDVSGEPEFIERMEARYHKQAAANGCYVASASGYDSIPGDFGVVLAQKQFQGPSVPCSVEAYLAVKPGPYGYKAHFATWQSAVLGIASVGALRRLRADIRAQGPAAARAPAPSPIGPKPKVPSGIEYISHPAIKSYSVPFPGADAAVVRRTQGILQAAGQPAVHFTARFLMVSRYYAWLTAIVGMIMTTLAKSSIGRSLLLRFPGFFSCGVISHEGPSQRQIDTTQSITTLVARGYSSRPESLGRSSSSRTLQVPDREVVLRITGPDPGYKATAIFVSQAAVSVLLERQQLPSPGVHTPGSLLGNTSYAQRLQARGIVIETLWDRQL